MWDAETDKRTGQPIWLASSRDPSVGWDVIEDMNYAEAELTKFDEKNKKPKPGARRWIVPVSIDSERPVLEGGLGRERYMREMETMQRDLTVRDNDGTELDIDRVRPPEGYNPADYG